MFQGLPIPEISATAGSADDGIILGSINQTLIPNVSTSVGAASTIFAWRLNADAGLSFTDISTAAGNDTVDDVLPFGSTAEFTSADTLYVACSDDIGEMYVRISLQGVWAGTGIALFDSTDGISANRQLAGVTDASNGFRATAGIYRITWTQPATPRVAFSPVPGFVPSQKWIAIKPVGFTAVTTAPKLSRIWLRHPISETQHTAYTTPLAGGMTDSVFGALENLDIFSTDDTAVYFTFSSPTLGIDWASFRRAGAAVTYVWEYLAADSTWKTLTGIGDGTNGFQNGPAAFSTTPTLYTIRWPIPTDWASKALTLSPLTAATGYWIRRRILVTTTPGPYPILLARARARTLGAANSSGVVHRTARTYQRIGLLRCGVPPQTNLVAQVVNLDSSQSASFTIPAGTEGPLEISLSTPLAVSTGQQAFLMHISGGTAQDLLLDIRE